MCQTTIDLKAILDDLKLNPVGMNRWEVPKKPPMHVPARIFTDEAGIKSLRADLREKDWSALRQLVNVATLPGIVVRVSAQQDITGYIAHEVKAATYSGLRVVDEADCVLLRCLLDI